MATPSQLLHCGKYKLHGVHCPKMWVKSPHFLIFTQTKIFPPQTAAITIAIQSKFDYISRRFRSGFCWRATKQHTQPFTAKTHHAI